MQHDEQQPQPGGTGSPAGTLDRADAVEAAKVGVVFEVAFEAVKPSFDAAAAKTADRYLDSLAALPPGTGFALGMAARVLLAAFEHRRSLIAGVRIFGAWVRRKFGGKP